MPSSNCTNHPSYINTHVSAVVQMQVHKGSSPGGIPWRLHGIGLVVGGLTPILQSTCKPPWGFPWGTPFTVIATPDIGVHIQRNGMVEWNGIVE